MDIVIAIVLIMVTFTFVPGAWTRFFVTMGTALYLLRIYLKLKGIT